MSLSKKHHLYWGTISHHRHTPFNRFFKYPIFMAYIDISSLASALEPSLFWNINKPAIVSYRREDYHGDPSKDLEDSVRKTLQEKTGIDFKGPIRLLTHLRYFGYCFNPVSFYYCFDENDKKVEVIMAEVTNTPWKERHSYVIHEHLDRNTEVNPTINAIIIPLYESALRQAKKAERASPAKNRGIFHCVPFTVFA